ncbi:MAG: hemolysin family protein [Actinomycetota bacterium]|nr:hemolysin family protein [Actinomycetota bacterium]
MTSFDVMLIVVAALLIVLGAVFAGADAALSRVSRVRAEELARHHRRGSRTLQEIIADPARYLNVVVLLRVTCELVATVLVTVVCLDGFASRGVAVLVAAAGMVLVSYIALGVAPRTLGRQHAESIALASAPVVIGISRVLGPLPRLLILLGNALTPGRGLREGPFASEAELRDLVDLAGENAVIEDRERAMIHSVFELGDTLVREVMVPRTDMVFVERYKTLRQALSLCLRSGFSRIPVIGESEDDVLGIVYLKDLVRRTYEYHQGESTERVESVMRPATFVPESKRADALLREMQAARIHIAVVVDEYGGTAGLITIEDILEEIVGDISDEYDRVQAPQVERLGEDAARVSARLGIDELGQLFGVELADEDVDTVGGLLAKHLGRVPIPGAQVDVDGLRLTAESTFGRRNRIGTVLAARVDAADSDPEHAGQNGRVVEEPEQVEAR